MVHYTIGALFTEDFGHVLLILKLRPEWQKGKFNLPGGKVEPGEDMQECIAREFKEETDINSTPDDWKLIGMIEGPDYKCGILTAIYNPEKHGEFQKMTDEKLYWCLTSELPILRKRIIPNLYWIVPFAINTWMTADANGHALTFGTFKYENK